jgi:hypothetical protein
MFSGYVVFLVGDGHVRLCARPSEERIRGLNVEPKPAEPLAQLRCLCFSHAHDCPETQDASTSMLEHRSHGIARAR